MTIPFETIPTTKSERWKYTNLPRALKNLRLEPGSVGWGNQVAHIDPSAPGAEKYGDTQLWDLNTREGRDVLFMNRGQDVDIQAHGGEWLSPRQIIHVPDGQEITVIERSGGNNEYWKNSVIQISVGKGAILNHYRLISESTKGVQTNFTHARIGRDAQYNAFTLIEGEGFVRNQIHVELQGDNGTCLLAGVNLLSGDQLADTTITIEHQAPHCRSSQTYKSVLDDKARGVFQGKVHVHQIAQKTDGYQLSNALILSPEAEMDTKPELEIYADDVKCSHGATTGRLDEGPLFYLRSRGVPEAQARALLIEAFCAQAIESIKDDNVREDVRGRISAWLNRKA